MAGQEYSQAGEGIGSEEVADLQAEGAAGILEVRQEEDEDEKDDRPGEEGDAAVREAKPAPDVGTYGNGETSEEEGLSGGQEKAPGCGGDLSPAAGDVRQEDTSDRRADRESSPAVCEADQDRETGQGHGVRGEGRTHACGRIPLPRLSQARGF